MIRFTQNQSFTKMRPENLLLRPTPTQFCTLGCPILDAFLGGGIPCNSITELVSESGCGKTQLSLQLLFTAQLPLHLNGLAASSLYLYSELPFPYRRFNQLLESFRLSHPILFASSRDPRDRIFTRDCHTAHHLLDLLLQLESRLQSPKETRLDIKLIVIDSIAALFRSEFENNPKDLKRRSSLFFKISSVLKSHARRFGIAVVLTNQVVDLMEDKEGLSGGVRVGNLEWLCTSGRRVCPALGLSWANCVNSRLFMSRYEVTDGEENALDGDYSGFVNRRKKRELHVVFAPHLPCSSCEFVIRKEGVFGVAR